LDATDRGGDAVLLGRRAVAAAWFSRAPKTTRWLIANLGESASFYAGQLDDMRRFASLALQDIFDPKQLPWISARFEADFRDLAASLGVGAAEEAKAALAHAYEMADASGMHVAETEMACQAAKYATGPDEIREWLDRCKGLAERF